MSKALYWGLLVLLLVSGRWAGAQRSYAAHSVLRSGAWYKIAVRGPGVYRLDMGFLKSLGLPASVPSSQLQVWGRREAMLPEANNAPRTDDLEQLAIQIIDGGDDVLSGQDYALFFATGPNQWLLDSLTKQYHHQKNLYSDRQYFYLTIKDGGKRITDQTAPPVASVSLTQFDERLFHELDSVNFLSSGKEWYGEEFADAPGRSLTQQFDAGADAVPNTAVTIISSVAARSIGSNSRFDVQLNGNAVHQLTVPAVPGGPNGAFAAALQLQTTTTTTQDLLTLRYIYSTGGFNAQGWLNWFEVFYKRALALPAEGQLLFRDIASVGQPAVSFSLGNAEAGTQVWQITDPFNPVAMKGTVSANRFVFSNEATQAQEYMGFSKSLVPEAVGAVPNQDLHQTAETDLIIISYPLFLAQAQRLAQFHREHDGLRTIVVTTDQVFNEFSAGIPDPAALRDFVKLYYDTYRATWSQSPKYLLLFGKGSFDPKARIQANTSLVPVYESAVSLDPLGTFTSDDFFGFLDDAEDINSTSGNSLDIGVGRVPAKTADDAQAFVDKVFAYHAPEAFGPWRTALTFAADDEDANLHLQDAETLTATAQSIAPLFNIQKIYLDAFRQEGGSAGSRYPQAVEANNNALYNGTLLWNYSGHGGPARLAEEVLLDQQIVNNLSNPNKLPLFVTATCDFAPYDNPTVNSLGENLLVRPKTGAIALTTTSRVVFAFSNRVLNEAFLRAALQKDASGKYRSLGEALRTAKNAGYQSGDVVNDRKFSLLGDPALTLAFPKLQVRATSINGMDISKSLDTLSATEMVTLGGEVRDASGALLPAFNGTVYLSLFDKPQTVTTLGNDASSTPVPVQQQTSLLFRGKASAVVGKFQFQFRLPKDLNYAFGRGRISLYAQNGKEDGAGASDSVVIGGISRSGSNDGDGPVIKAYLNDERFVAGSIANSSPILLVKLSDSSGINSSGAGIGHDIVATLDDDNKTYYVLNNFYESDVDDPQHGSIRFQLPELPAGPHTLRIKAWDVLNNSGEYSLAFTIVPTADLAIDHILNYPNPFTTRTAFWFEHNQPGMDLKVRIDIFTVSGKRIKTILQTINTPGNRSSEVEWDGRDDQGSKPGRGVYLYHFQVRTANGQHREKWERLVLLN